MQPGGGSRNSRSSRRHQLITIPQVAQVAGRQPALTPLPRNALTSVHLASAASGCTAPQVRALQGGSWKGDEAQFLQLAEASLALVGAYVTGHKAGKPGA